MTMRVLTDIQHRLIACEELFQGTLAQASVHPREVVRAAVNHNAAAVILAHNHPSGPCQPSETDLTLTRTLTQTLKLIDVKVIDHFIVSANSYYSFAAHGKL